MCGVLSFGLYNLALNEGERRINPGTAAMLVAVGPILIALLAGYLPGPRLPPDARHWLCDRVCRRDRDRSHHHGKGNVAGRGAVLCLAAAAFYAGGCIRQKPGMARAPGLHVTWIACAVGLILFCLLAPKLVDGSKGKASSIAWMVYLGIFPTAIGFMTWAYALSRRPPGGWGDNVPRAADRGTAGLGHLGETPVALAFLGGALSSAAL